MLWLSPNRPKWGHIHFSSILKLCSDISGITLAKLLESYGYEITRITGIQYFLKDNKGDVKNIDTSLKNYIFENKMFELLIQYIQKALEKAEYKKLEDGSWFAEIPWFEGVWANGSKLSSVDASWLKSWKSGLFSNREITTPFQKLRELKLI